MTDSMSQRPAQLLQIKLNHVLIQPFSTIGRWHCMKQFDYSSDRCFMHCLDFDAGPQRVDYVCWRVILLMDKQHISDLALSAAILLRPSLHPRTCVFFLLPDSSIFNIILPSTCALLVLLMSCKSDSKLDLLPYTTLIQDRPAPSHNLMLEDKSSIKMQVHSSVLPTAIGVRTSNMLSAAVSHNLRFLHVACYSTSWSPSKSLILTSDPVFPKKCALLQSICKIV